MIGAARWRKASTREQCIALYPGSNPGRASRFSCVAGSKSARTDHFAFGKLQAVRVAHCGFDDRIDQARETSIEILAAKLHVTSGADDAGLDQPGLAQFRKVIGEI